jgi:hypothetical protein
VNTCIEYRLAPTIAHVSELEDFRAVHGERTWSLKQVDSLGLSRKNIRQMDLRCAPFKATEYIGSDCGGGDDLLATRCHFAGSLGSPALGCEDEVRYHPRERAGVNGSLMISMDCVAVLKLRQ